MEQEHFCTAIPIELFCQRQQVAPAKAGIHRNTARNCF
jgi:hypothetical protein